MVVESLRDSKKTGLGETGRRLKSAFETNLNLLAPALHRSRNCPAVKNLLHPSARMVVALLFWVTSSYAAFADSSAADVAFFETHIRPVLAKHCYECHSAESDQLGGNFRLDQREAMRAGGESGPPIVEGDPEESLLIQALEYDGVEMPPSEPLHASVVAKFKEWIERGAVDPRVEVAGETSKSAEPERLWSLEPVELPVLPDVEEPQWAANAIDRFVMARMEAETIKPAHLADERALVRRLYFDLIGLPPTFDELRTYANAIELERDQAIRLLVDELLSRPQFGERWGRHWLDVARFGESNGNDGLGRNPTFPHAWRYRDYVIDSFNQDVPYDQFLIEQIAGDLLPADSPEQSDRQKIATGFLAMAAKPAKAMNNNFAMDVVADQIDVVGRGVMGISVSCARCHDHKFDPVSIGDYYALAGIFTSTETMWGAAGNEKLTAPPTDLHVLEAAARNPPPEDFVETVILLDSATGKPKIIPQPKWEKGTPLAMGVRDAKKIADCQVNINGDAKKLGKLVPRGFLPAIQLETSDAFKPGEAQSGRLELANWLTHPDHPLTSRVMVNRIWSHLFGSGIVRTPNDYGVYGEPPTHRELFDYLATRFVQNGWSVKSLIREIVLSRTYQLSSDPSLSLMERDPENRLLARHSRRRMDAEVIRDSMLAASGNLDLTPASGSIIQHRDILVNIAASLHQPSQHRSVYLCYLRSSPPPELAPFNLPDFTQVVGQRESTLLSSQTLYLFNSPFVIRLAKSLADRVCESSSESNQRIRVAFRYALQRDPTEDEFTSALAFVGGRGQNANTHKQAWASFCQALLMTNEFRYVD